MRHGYLSGLVSALILAPILLLFGPLGWNGEAAPAAWSLTGSMSTARVVHSLTLLASGKVLAAGGQTNTAAATGAAEVYDPTARTWTTTGSLTFSKSFHTATLLSSGKVLVAAGFTSAAGVGTPGVTTSADLYDPSAGTFSSTGALTTARQAHTATLLGNGKVLVVGGVNAAGAPTGVLGSAELYDPAAGSWSPTGSLTIARWQHTATLLPNGKVLVAGGASPSGFEPTAELYDPVTGTWTRTGNLSTSRANHTATLLSTGKVLAAGGEGPFVASAELYDPVAGTWSPTGSMSTARSRYAATLLGDGRVLVEGGVSSSSLSALASSELYNPATGLWNLTGSLNTGRFGGFGLTAARLSDGTVLVAGGVAAVGTALASAELYQAGPPPGSLLAWGLNANGQVGDGTTTLRSSPVSVNGISGVVAVSGGGAHTLAAKGDGTLWSWGSNASGQLGDGSTTDHSTPVQITALNNVIAVAAGSSHSVALKADGTVWAWGANNSGQLGNSTTTGSATPVQVCASGATAPCTAFLTGVSAIAASSTRGGNNSLALKSDGTVWAWGENSFGQLGNGTTTGSTTPVQVLGPACECFLSGVTAISAGGLFNLAVRQDGTVVAWGANDQGQLGDGTTTSRFIPIQVCVNGTTAPCTSFLTGITAVAAGGFHSLAAKSDGTVVAWGSNTSGQLGIGTTVPISKWSTTGSLATSRYFHAAALLGNGKVLVSGGTSAFPSVVPLTSAELYDSAAGTWSATGSMGSTRSHHSATLLSNGKVLVAGGFGNLASAELYDPTPSTWSPTGAMSTPRYAHTATVLPGGAVLVAGGVTGFTGDGLGGPRATNAAELYNPTTGTWTATGSMNTPRFVHTATLLSNGKVLVTGGASGPGNTLVVASAELFDPTVGTWTSIASSMSVVRSQHTATLLPGGKVLVAGGVGSSFSPVQASADLYDPVANTFSATGALSSGRYAHTATLLASGQVLATGGFGGSAALASAELYDPASGSWSPTDSMSNARFVHTATTTPGRRVLIAGGTNNSVSLASAELFTRVPGPVPVSGLTSVVALSAGQFFSLALMSNGTVSAWGDNTFGQLGDGTTVNRAAPVQVGTPSGVSAIAAGRFHSIALRSPGALRGVAQCGGVILAGGTVQLLSGSAVVASTMAGTDGSYLFTGTAPNATYSVSYRGTATVTLADGTSKTFTLSCGASVITDATGGAVAPVPPDLSKANRNNHTWPNCFQLTSGVPVQDFIFRAGQSAWFCIHVDPEQRVKAVLKGSPNSPLLPVPMVLTAYRDIRQVADSLKQATGPVRAAPDDITGIPDDITGIPDDITGIPDDITGIPDDITGIPDDITGIPDVGPSGLPPDALAPDAAPGETLPAELSADAYSSAQTRSLIGVSARRGRSGQLVVRNTWGNKGNFYFRVKGRNGAFAPDTPFTLEVRVLDTPCILAPPMKSLLSAPTQTPRTLILTNSNRVNTRASLVDRTTSRPLNPTEAATFIGTLSAFAQRPEVGGVVVDLANDGTTVTLTQAVSPGTQTVAVNSTAQLAAGQLLSVDTGANQETVTITSLTATSVTANFTKAHALNTKAATGMAANYLQWDAQKSCSSAANVVTDAIKDLMAQYRVPNPATLQYVVLAGGDPALPYRRVPDGMPMKLFNEKNHQPGLGEFTSSVTSFKQGYVLSNDSYASFNPISRMDHDLFLPELAVGRLVETVEDISAVINAYTSVNGVISPQTSFISAYDFLAPLGDFLGTQFAAMNTVDRLIEPGGLGPKNPLAWTADQLRQKLFGPTNYKVLALNGHFSANRTLAADYLTRVQSLEVANDTSGRFANALVISPGCHSAYNIVDGDALAATPEVDWPQAFARQGATLIGNSGYGYGSSWAPGSNFRQYAAALISNLAVELNFLYPDFADGRVPIGKALTNAKRAYVSQLPTLAPVDEKSMTQLSLFGLPMWSVSLPGPRSPRPGAATVTPTPRLGTTLSTFDRSDTFVFNRHDVSLRVAGSNPPTFVMASYFDVNGNIYTAPYKPVLPSQAVSVAASSGAPARGTVLLSADYTDLPGFRPYADVPATEFSGIRPWYGSNAFTPVRIDALNPLVGQFLVVRPFQYRSDMSNGLRLPTGTGRRYDRTLTRVYYSTAAGDAALADAPPIYNVALSANGTKVHVDVTIGGRLDVDIADVFATSTARSTSPQNALFGHWNSLALVGGPAVSNGVGFVRHYTGDIDTASTGAQPTDVQVFIQAASGTGLVTRVTNDGAYYSVLPVTVTASAPKIGTSLALQASSPSTTYRSVIPVTATLTDATGKGVPNKVVSFTLPGSAVSALTDAGGVASAKLHADVLPSAEPYTIAAAFEEDLDPQVSPQYLGASDSKDILVVPAPTAFIPSGLSTIEYSNSAVIATLTSQGEAVKEQPVTISLDATHSLTSITDTAGGVVFDTMDFGQVAPLSTPYTVTISYPGTAARSPNSIQIPLTVQPAQATVIFLSGPQSGSLVQLNATLTPLPHNSVGDITRATVTYTLQPGNITAGPVPVLPDGTAPGSVPLTTPVNAGLYTVTATVGGFYTGTTTSPLFAVYDPTKSVAAAGSVTPTTLPPGNTASFAFALKYLAAPSVSAVTGGGMSPAGPYGVAYSFMTFLGESPLSAPAFATLTASNNQIQVSAMSVPDGVTAVKFYLTAVPTGGTPGFVVTMPVSGNQIPPFTINQPGNGVLGLTAPVGAVLVIVMDPATGALNGLLTALGTPGGFDWLVITGNPSNHGVFQGTGIFNGVAGARFRVIVDKAATGDRFEIHVWNAGGSFDNPNLLLAAGAVVPLPLTDDPTQFGVVFRPV